MFASVFSCATISTVAGKNWLLPLWSPWVCVLMMWVIGLSLTLLTWSRIAWPLLASLVSTSTMPLAATKATVFPPAPGIMYRLSLTFWIMPTPGAGPRPAAGAGAGCWAFTVPHAAAATLAITISPRTIARRMIPPEKESPYPMFPYATGSRPVSSGSGFPLEGLVLSC